MVLSRSQFKQEFEEIHRELETMYNTYIQQQIIYPVIDTLSLHFTYIFLTSLGYSKEMRHIYAVSQGLIQLGLDSHDEVNIKEIRNSEEEVTKQQLTVLSGDLFSGYYYYYLAGKNELELIRKWSEVIQEINIKKTEHHLQSKRHANSEVDKCLYQLKQQLTMAVFRWYDAPSFWSDIFSLTYQLKTANYMDQANSRLKDKAILLQEKIEELPVTWLKDELSLWLDGVPKTNLVLGN